MIKYCLLGLGLLTSVLQAQTSRALLKDVPKSDLSQLHETIRAGLTNMLAQIEQAKQDARVSDIELGSFYGQLALNLHAMELEDAALVAYENALILDADNLRWPYFAGFLYKLKGQLDRAQECYRGLTLQRPQDPWPLIRLGNVLLDKNLNDEAQDSFNGAAKLEPNNASTWFGLGQAASNKGDSSAAIQHFTRALELQPKATSIHYLLALAYRKSGDDSLARQHMQARGEGKIELLDPHLKDLNDTVTTMAVHVALALAADEKQFSAPKFEAFIVSQLTSRDGIAEYLVQQAQQGLKTAQMNAIVAARIYYAAGIVYEKRQQPQQSRTCYQLACDKGNLFIEPCLRYLNSIIAAGDSLEAIDLLNELADLEPNDARIRFSRAAALMNSGHEDNLKLAVIDLKLAITLNPDVFQYHERLAIANELLGNHEQAKQSYSDAVAMATVPEDRARIHLNLAKMCQSQGDFPCALQHLDEAIALLGPTPDLSYTRATIIGALKRYDEAAQAMADIRKSNPDHLDASLGEIVALIMAQSWDSAQLKLESALSNWPNNRRIQQLMARMLASSPVKTNRDGARALALTPAQNQDWHEIRAMALAESNRFDEAVRILKDIEEDGSQMTDKDRAELAILIHMFQQKQSCCDEYDSQRFLKP